MVGLGHDRTVTNDEVPIVYQAVEAWLDFQAMAAESPAIDELIAQRFLDIGALSLDGDAIEVGGLFHGAGMVIESLIKMVQAQTGQTRNEVLVECRERLDEYRRGEQEREAGH